MRAMRAAPGKGNDMTRVGIIGCGYISRFHSEGYERAGAKIVHACDLRKEAAEAVGSRYSARVSTDYRAVIEDRDVDLVSVCTIASTHKEICLAAMACGKGVVCEKTLTDNAADSAELVRASRQTKAFLSVAYMKNYFPAVVQAKQMLAEMGDVTSIYVRTWHFHPQLWQSPAPEDVLQHPSRIVRNYGGGMLVCGGSHVLNLLCGFAGRPTKVIGAMQSRPGMDFDIQTNAMLWLPAGGVAHFEAFWHPFSAIGYERNGWDERIEINTAKGRLELYTVLWNGSENHGVLLVHTDAETGRVTEYRFPAVNVFDLEMAGMIEAFEGGGPATPSVADGYVVDELIEHITSSHKQGGKGLPVTYRVQ